MRPLILTCHGHLFKTWKSDLQLCTLFKPYNIDMPTPKNLGGGQNGISSLIDYFKMRMKLEKKLIMTSLSFQCYDLIIILMCDQS